MRTGILLAALAMMLVGCANSLRRVEVLRVVDVGPAPIEVTHGASGRPLVLVSDDATDDLGAPPAPAGDPVGGISPALREDMVVRPQDVPTPVQALGSPDDDVPYYSAPVPTPQPYTSYGAYALPDEEPPAGGEPPDAEEMPLDVIEPPAPPADTAPRFVRAPDLMPAPCAPPAKDPCACGDDCPEGYVGMSGNVLPGLGFGVDFGAIFKRTDCVIWSIEGGMSYHDFTNAISPDPSSGKLFVANLGVRALFLPQSRLHPFAKAGIGWYHATGTPAQVHVAQIDLAGDYLGGYLGFGALYEIDKHWTTGPEFRFFMASNIEALPPTGTSPNTRTRGTRHFSYIPMVYWHLHYNF